jgi:PadR family transcriptional regulator PadR
MPLPVKQVDKIYFFRILEEMTSSRGEIELLIMLALIRLGPDAYGVPIAHEIESTARRSVALASIYATLERLEERGLTASRLGEATHERGGRAKRYFQITAAGLRDVRSRRASLVRMWSGVRQLEGGQA